MPHLLSVSDLSVAIQLEEGLIELIRQVDFQVDTGEFLGLVGESGSGKSLTALAILGLLPKQCRVLSGRIELAGENLLELSERRRAQTRGGRVAMIFQEPMTALNPVLKVGYQIAEAVRAHRRGDRQSAWQDARRLLDLVAIPSAVDRLDDYPHQLSGGQRQRIMIAMALAGDPDLLIADEPTSALDVTVQVQILDLLERLRVELGLTILLITHDLGVVAETCQRVLVMYAGELVEQARVGRLFEKPAHPYSQALLAALPRLGQSPTDGILTTLAGPPAEARCRPSGCPFHPRCPEVMNECRVSSPPLVQLSDNQLARCWLHSEPVSREAEG